MHTFEMYLERPRDLPDEAQWQMLAATAELRKREADVGSAFQAGMQELAGEYTEELHKVLGPKNVAKYVAARRAHREKLRAARLKLMEAQDLEKHFSAYRHRLLAESRTSMKQFGVDTKRIAHVVEEMRQKQEDLLSKTVENDDIIGEPPREKKQNKTFQPAYSGWQWSGDTRRWYGDSSDNLPVPSYNVVGNNATGELGATTSSSLSDASDYDEAFAKVRIVQLQWYKMPTTGQITARFNSENIDCQNSGSTENEWGYSELNLNQRHQYFARVYSPTVSPSIYWPHNKKEYGVLGGPPPTSNFGFEYIDQEVDDHSWSYGSWVGVQSNLYPVTIPGVFAAGTWVLVGVGIQNRNWFRANDTGVTSHVTHKVWVNEIGIGSTGS